MTKNKTEIIQLIVSPVTRETLVNAAKYLGLSISSYIASAALKDARLILSEGRSLQNETLQQ